MAKGTETVSTLFQALSLAAFLSASALLAVHFQRHQMPWCTAPRQAQTRLLGGGLRFCTPLTYTV